VPKAAHRSLSSGWARRHARNRPSPDPQRYRHLISSIKIVENAAAGPLELVANFLVVRTMQDGEVTIFGAGRYVDRVKRDAGSWKFASKIVVLDSRS
jgi:3-phenylpropionate/cinnamic acid dioxygenase small subunit